MKIPRITNAVSYIGDDLITAASDSKKKIRHIPWLKLGSVAACFAVLAIAGAAILPSLTGGSTVPSSKYKYQIDAIENDNVVWPWEYLTNGEKYGTVNFNGKEYRIKNQNPINEKLLGDVLGSCESEGVDIYNDKKYTETFEVRTINGISEEKLVACGADGEFYVYTLDDTAKPATFGELMKLYGLAQTLELNHFTVCEGYEEKGCYNIKDDTYIWQVLSECDDAKLYDKEDFFDVSNRNYLSFTATSDALGIYKRVVYISEDGYFATNIFDYSYIYFIGEDAAGKIISHAKSNSAESEFEPYENTVSGTLTEIGDGYVLIDDSVLCTNEKDGTLYKALTDDIRMKRCIKFAGIKVGDTVVVKYGGEISDNNQINGAYSMNKGTLMEGDIDIPE